MRVTSKMMSDTILSNIQSALARMQLAQTQVASGKVLQKPSDGGVAVSKTLKIRDLLADNEQYQKNIDDGTGWVENTEPALDSMTEVITSLKEIALNGASDQEDASARAALGEQVEGLIQQLITLGNTRYDQRYLFSGTNTLTAPYSASQTVSDEQVTIADSDWVDLKNARLEQGSVTLKGSSNQTYVEGVDYEVDYSTGRIRRLAGGAISAGEACQASYSTQGTSGVTLNVASTDGAVNREIAPGVWEKINIGGQEVLSSKIDVFGLLVQIKNALFKNDGTTVNQALSNVDSALDQVSSALSKVGLASKNFDLYKARMDSQNVNLQALQSKLEDADVAEVMVRLQTEQTAYQAALQAGAKIMQTDLLDYLT